MADLTFEELQAFNDTQREIIEKLQAEIERLKKRFRDLETERRQEGRNVSAQVIKLKTNEYILAVVCAPAAGPGWANTPAWVVIRGPKGIREECLQPEEQSTKLRALYGPAAAMHKALLSAVPAKTARPSRRRGRSDE